MLRVKYKTLVPIIRYDSILPVGTIVEPIEDRLGVKGTKVRFNGYFVKCHPEIFEPYYPLITKIIKFLERKGHKHLFGHQSLIEDFAEFHEREMENQNGI